MTEENRTDVAPAPAPTQPAPQVQPIDRMYGLYIEGVRRLRDRVTKEIPGITPAELPAVMAPILGIVAREAAIGAGFDLNMGSLGQVNERNTLARLRAERESRPVGFGSEWLEPQQRPGPSPTTAR